MMPRNGTLPPYDRREVGKALRCVCTCVDRCTKEQIILGQLSVWSSSQSEPSVGSTFHKKFKRGKEKRVFDFI